ncbi:hypothetical protein EJ06DRAFT_257451 [Trichodelitschia bisporula]|uniref:Uncharacterized protein n=1 Tax=Trichodelitschia bisporula TaxID=703511 RepID=A0A6G1HIZ4_9PEZI|nr:hypothetical protein EJ06DRAFT_257451 [Trichodelitschia bisporula]
MAFNKLGVAGDAQTFVTGDRATEVSFRSISRDMQILRNSSCCNIRRSVPLELEVGLHWGQAEGRGGLSEGQSVYTFPEEDYILSDQPPRQLSHSNPHPHPSLRTENIVGPAHSSLTFHARDERPRASPWYLYTAGRTCGSHPHSAPSPMRNSSAASTRLTKGHSAPLPGG